MDKCREAFEKKFPIPAHWIEFDEKRNKYYCPYVADAKASEYQAMWEAWQSRQSEFDAMTEALLNQTQLLAKQKVELEEKDKRVESLEKQLKRSVIAIEDGEIDWALNNIKKTLRGNNANS